MPLIEEGSVWQDTLEKVAGALFQVQIIHFMHTVLLKSFRVEKHLGAKSPIFWKSPLTSGYYLKDLSSQPPAWILHD